MITRVGWICLVIGIGSPLRVALEYYDERQYQPGTSGRLLAISALLGLALSGLTGAAGWNLIKRHSWGLLTASLAAGATIAASAFSLAFAGFLFFHLSPEGRDRTFLLSLVASNALFLVLNISLALSGLTLFVLLLRPATRSQFPRSKGQPALLSAAALISGGLWLLAYWSIYRDFLLYFP
jgi:hypothetical protein